MWLLLCTLALADSFLQGIELVCTPTLRGKDCGDGPLEPGLENSRNAIEHAALLMRYNGDRSNGLMVERIRRFTRYSDNPYRDFDLAFVRFYSSSFGGRAGEADLMIRTLYDPAVHLIVALCVAQYDAYVLNHGWDQPSREKVQVRLLLQKATLLNRDSPVPGFDQSLANTVAWINKYPGYAGF
jgi:hypothetical protein